MGIRSALTELFKPETKEAPRLPTGARVMMDTVGSTVVKKEKYEDFAKEGYSENAVVYRCVNEIAKGAASIPFQLFSGDVEIEQHPLISLLRRPNPLMAQNEYFEALVSYLLLSGNSYALMSGPDNSPPQELHLLRPDRIKIEPSDNYIPEAYQYLINGRTEARYPVDSMTGSSVVKHFKLFHPLNDYYGMSPIQAAATDIDQHNLAARHNVNLLSNGARPTGAVIFNPVDGKSGMPRQLTPDQRSQVLSDLDARFNGAHNAGRTMLLEGDFDWKEMGLSPKDMDFLQLKNMSARDIALCYGVPGQLVGIPDSNTYSNMAEARLALYEETIIPLVKRIESDLNEWLSPSFDDRLEIRFDIDSIPAMAERRAKIYANIIEAVREGVITRNEARDRLNLSPIEGGDDVYINASLFPLGSPQESPVDEALTDEANKSFYDEEFSLDESKEEVGPDLFTTEGEAQRRAREIGCVGTHTIDRNGQTIYMPCESHDDYEQAVEEDNKAISDVNLKPTAEMAQEAIQALEWRKEYNRGGTMVGVARAAQLKNRENLSPSTVRRMFSFFSRHEVDKRATGFRRGEDGFPTAGRIAWGLWGGDAGFSWSRRKVKELDAEKALADLIEEYAIDGTDEQKATAISEKIKEALRNKVKDHNDKHGDKKGKKVTQRMLEAVFRRGVGAYHTNPQSVRPSVTSPDQWGLGRVNAFLRAVRTNRFQSGKFDTDLLPEGHPLRTGK